MRVAIVGSRPPELIKLGGKNPWFRETRSAVGNWIDSNLTKNDIVISGGAVGVDTYAKESAYAAGIITIVVYPAWVNGKSAGFARNSVIVELADKLVAFWDGKSKGTADSIEKANSKGIPVEIILLD